MIKHKPPLRWNKIDYHPVWYAGRYIITMTALNSYDAVRSRHHSEDEQICVGIETLEQAQEECSVDYFRH